MSRLTPTALYLERLAGKPPRPGQFPSLHMTPAQAQRALASMYGLDCGPDVKAWRTWIHLRPMPDLAAKVRALAPRLLPLLRLRERPGRTPLVYSRTHVRRMLVKAFGVDFKFDEASWKQWLDENP